MSYIFYYNILLFIAIIANLLLCPNYKLNFIIYACIHIYTDKMGFSDGSVPSLMTQESSWQYKKHRFDPRLGTFPGEGNGNPLQCSCLGNPMKRGDSQTSSWSTKSFGHNLATKSSKRHDILIYDLVLCMLSAGLPWTAKNLSAVQDILFNL